MSLRKFMHPKNQYKKAPDFKQLAVQYPEFRKIAKVDLAGKVNIDFKDEETLRVLTEVLLKHDFNLNVTIPVGKLVPTLPLRLNYILWLEDLLNHAAFTEMDEVIGIDIGTGAVSIYPLLIAKMYRTHMVGSEIDESSVQSALKQIENNNLQHLIKVLRVTGDTVLKGVLEEDKEYHFSMCNPPFFEVGGAEETVMKKLPPRNAHTGNERELMIQGGERSFVTQMIEESIELQDRVKIYTTMIGRKKNLLYLIRVLRNKKIENFIWTEFCQGHTKRWGLAWTFVPKHSLDLSNAPVIRKSGDFIAKLLRDQHPTEVVFPLDDKFITFVNVIEVLQQIMEELNVTIKDINLPVDDFDGWACQITAHKHTWSHARRKRRIAQRQTTENQNEHEATKIDAAGSSKTEKGNGISELQPSNSREETQNPFLVCNFFADVIEPEDESGKTLVKICMVFEKGVGGKSALETLRQYLINKLDVREYFQQYCCSTNKRKRKRLKGSISGQNDPSTESKHVMHEDTSVDKYMKPS